MGHAVAGFRGDRRLLAESFDDTACETSVICDPSRWHDLRPIPSKVVIPAKAEIHSDFKVARHDEHWIPACAGMTVLK
jgi:hypothetical protein